MIKVGRKNRDIYPMGHWKLIYEQLRALHIGAFSWEGLPESVNVRYLESALLDFGMVAIFKDEQMDTMLALQASKAGKLNQYYEPTALNIIGGDGFYRMVTAYNQFTEEGVAIPVWENMGRYTPKLRLIDFAKRIALADKTIDMNIFAQRTPVSLVTSKTQEFSTKNMYRDYEDFTPVIIRDDSMANRIVEVLDTKAPIVFDKIEEHKRKIWNEALAYIGIESNFSEKNERLVANEVLVSNGLAIAQRKQKLEARQALIGPLKKLYNLDVTVKFNNLSVLDFTEGEDNNGSIHDTTKDVDKK